jgi:hypothetical protein
MNNSYESLGLEAWVKRFPALGKLPEARILPVLGVCGWLGLGDRENSQVRARLPIN